MTTIDIIMPSRERPDLALRTALSARETCDDKARMKIYIGIDRDEPRMFDYKAFCEENDITLLVSPTSGSAPQCVDWMWRQTEGSIIVLATDDVIFRTKAWDRFLDERFAKQPYLVISPNLSGRRKLEQPICTRLWPQTVGCFFPPEFFHFCADEWMQEVAERAGLLAYCMDLKIEHMHPKYHKGQWDDVYLRKRGERGHDLQMEDKQRLIDMSRSIDEAAKKLSAAAYEWQERACA